MHGISRRQLIGGAALTALLANARIAASADAPYRFSPVNQYGINLTTSYWNPILAYVSEKSGIPLELKIGRTSADTTSFVLAKEVDFAFTNHLFSPERERLGWKVFGRRLTAPVQGQIVVPSDSAITSVAQLAGMKVSFPGPEALVSYKIPYAYLLSKGIAAKPVFSGNADGAVVQLLSGTVSAAGVNSQLIEGYARRERKTFRVLWASEPMHDLALMSSSRVPDKAVKAIAKAFVEMYDNPRGRAVIEQVSREVGLPGDARFVASDGSEYGADREFFRTAPELLR